MDDQDRDRDTAEHGQGPTATQELEEGPSTPNRRPLRRSGSDRVIAGVAGGLADYVGLSSLAVRCLFGLTFVAIVFEVWNMLGLAVVAYALLWIFVPRDDVGVSPADRITRRFPRIGPALGVLILLGGAAAIAAQLEPWLVWPVLLIGGGLLLFRGDKPPRVLGEPARSPIPPAAPPPPPSPTMAPQVTEPAAPRPPRERSPLGWLGMGIALLVVGTMAILQNLDAIDVRLVRYAAMVLVILGVAMLVGAFVGRARWLVFPAVLVVPVLLVSSLITVPLEGGIGDETAFPRSSSAVQASYRRIVGRIFLDLSSLQGTDAQPVISASTGIGEITIVVPFDAHVIAEGRAGIGIVDLGAEQTERIADAFLETTWEPRFGDGPTITLDLETGIGDVYVLRNAPTRKELRALQAEEQAAAGDDTDSEEATP